MLLGAICLAGLLGTGCDSGPDDIVIFNGTDETVVLFSMWRGTERMRSEIPAQQAYAPRDECIEADLIARDQDGNELARRLGPFCRGHPMWVIEELAE